MTAPNSSMESRAAYDADFYRQHVGDSERSARTVLPFLLQALPIRSVIDVGCGTGAWLRACMELGIADALGVDGDHLRQADLRVPAECVVTADLEQPLTVGRQFDLALSLEVAEHLCESRASGFVKDLTQLSDHILFSAAIPSQGGTGHVNEQWPAYWSNLFSTNGFIACDVLRLRFWNDPAVKWWYSQNMILYVRDPQAAMKLAKISPQMNAACLPLVHPDMLHKVLDERDLASTRLQNPSLRFATQSFFRSFQGWIGRRRTR